MAERKPEKEISITQLIYGFFYKTNFNGLVNFESYNTVTSESAIEEIYQKQFKQINDQSELNRDTQ